MHSNFVVIDVDGNPYIICGANIKKNIFSYGYFLNLELMNGKSVSIAYAYYKEHLKEPLAAIAHHMENGEQSFDMRKEFVRIQSKGSACDCTIARK